MKNYILIFALGLMLFSCKCTDVSNDHRPTEIYLTVICEITNESNIKDCIRFSDNRDNKVSLTGLPEYFTSEVNPNQPVTWKGVNNSYPKVEVLEVNFKNKTGGVLVMDKMNYTGNNGVVRGKVKNKGEVPNLSSQFYSITFSVDNVTYTIDPVVQFHE